MRSLIFQNHDLYQIHFTSCSCDVLIYSSYIHLSYFINVNTIEALLSGDLWRVQYLSPNEGFSIAFTSIKRRLSISPRMTVY